MLQINKTKQQQKNPRKQVFVFGMASDGWVVY